MTQESPIDLSVIDAKELENIKGKKERAAWVMQIVKENGLDKDQAFMNEIDSLIEELLKEFDVVSIQISCNNTTSLGQLSFGEDGKVYSKLSANDNEFDKYEIKEPCFIKLISKDKHEKEIKIYDKTGFIEKL